MFSSYLYPKSQFSLLLCLMLAGCSSAPTAIESVLIDATDASEKALEQYDKNGDGSLDDTELAAVPGILKYKDKYDTNQDGRVTAEEIKQRIELWEKQAMGIRSVSVNVQLNKRPLAGAQVQFTPESYLGAGPKVAYGTTNAQGYTKITVAREDLPASIRETRIRGIYGGTYKVEVTHPRQAIAARFNRKTTLGEEIARDTQGDRILLQVEKK